MGRGTKWAEDTEWEEVKSVAEHLHVHHVVHDDARNTTLLHPLRLARCLIERGNTCFTRWVLPVTSGSSTGNICECV